MCKIWATAGRELRRSLPHSGYLYSGKFHPKNDKFVATAGFDGIVRIWNRTNGQCLAEGEPHGTRVNSVVFAPDGEHLYSGDARGVIGVWETTVDGDGIKLVRQREVRHREIEGIAITHLSTGKLHLALLVYTQDGLVRNFETDPMEVLQRFTGAKCTKFRMQAQFSPDSNFVFAGSKTCSIML
jgi:WD40 repeat protein